MRNHLKFVLYLLLAIAFSAAHAGSYEDFFQAIKRDDPKAINELLRRGFDPNTIDPSGRQGLFLALQEGSLKAAEALVDWPKTKVEWRSAKDESPLMIAALKGHKELVRKLIARDADVNKPGWAPLHYAATGGHLEIMLMLLDEHAFIDAESPNKTTPLMMAAMYGSTAAVRLLLEAGADPVMRNELGMSAVDFAQRANRPDAAELIAAAIRNRQPKGKW
ncbi:ankyrin repeat domain-containing protein [Ramlibacter sp. USB13]|uniref:Ankyrin repeat domain-containing protein n=1 Tax=Ramlibacter cellulosilyticus TaxID=2764187 RepID=A0A923MWA9_9BURK|nr:ankyrin repeat domain-containing protein [Ramlibacter cellulosilyticus]MBC5786231.1 ankyrin repeat domain-containing protein [Ramlibacter cellulosilyticus]